MELVAFSTIDRIIRAIYQFTERAQKVTKIISKGDQVQEKEV